MEQQLVAAVEIAQNPTAVQDASLPAQALAYLEHLKQNTHESWQAGWATFTARDDHQSKPKYDGAARLFGLNLVGDFLENRVAHTADPAGSVAYLQESAVAYLHSEYVSGSGDGGVAFSKNKLAQTLVTLLLQTYSLPPPFTLLPTLLSLMHTHPPTGSDPTPPTPVQSSSGASPKPLNPVMTDLVLRVLHDLSVTLGSDVSLRAVRSRERLQRDAAIRDEIRAHNAVEVAGELWGALAEALQRVDEESRKGAGAGGASAASSGSPREWNVAKAVEVAEMATRVAGDWVSWIDISLMVNQQTVSLLFSLLQHSAPPLRAASCDTLVEVISKGMKPADKVELARVLNLTDVVGSLQASTRSRQEQAQASGDEEGVEALVEFRSRLARLANAVAVELTKVVEETTAEEATREEADNMLSNHLPVVLHFMSDEYDDLADAVLSSINLVLGIYKKFRRRNQSAPASAFLSSAKLDFLARLLDVALAKMKYGDDMDWPGEEGGATGSDDGSEDEESARFLRFRKNLQVVVAAVASIDEAMFAARVANLISSTVAGCEAMIAGNGPPVTWQQAELAVFAAYWFGDVLLGVSGQPKSGITPATFVQLPPAEAAKAIKSRAPSSTLASAPLSHTGEVVEKVLTSSISAFPHAALQSQYFETAVRYSAFFVARPQALPQILPAFLDWRGIHHEKQAVRLRTFYLLYRFVSECRAVVSAEFVPKLLESMQDVLVVRAELPAAKPDEDPLEKAVSSASSFDSQLFLFETSGTLISMLSASPDQQGALLKTIVDPLSEQLRVAVGAYQANRSDLQLVLQVHHLFLALASLAKGFPTLHSAAPPPSPPEWMTIFQRVSEQLLVALRELSAFSAVREAARGAFARVVSTVGAVVLPYVPGLLDALMVDTSAAELVDLLSFVGLLISRYKDTFTPILDELLSALLARIFYFLNQGVSGTDDALQRTELVRGYVNFVNVLFNSGFEWVLCSERNREQLDTVLQSLAFYASTSNVGIQRLCYAVLTRLVSVWGGPESGAGAAAAGVNGSHAPKASSSAATPAPAASASSTTSKPRPPEASFERYMYQTMVPLLFEPLSKPDFDLGDAQSQMVVGEAAVLAKTMYARRGERLAEYVGTVYLPGVSCPPQLAEEFVASLRSLEAKEFKKALEAFIKKSRGL